MRRRRSLGADPIATWVDQQKAAYAQAQYMPTVPSQPDLTIPILLGGAVLLVLLLR